LYDIVDDSDLPLQAGVTTSSRHFKKAVQRNRVKRVMREAYRLHKIPLQEALASRQKSLILFFIYVGKELPDFAEVNKKMQLILQKLLDLLNQQTEN
jgi:ribonuclease P protein component